MPSLSVATRPNSLLKPTHVGATLQRHVRAVIVSPLMEVRQPLLRTLEGLSADVIVCSTRMQAEDLLSRQVVDVVFCDEHLPDGSYCDLIHSNHCENRVPRVVVATRTGEWGLYFEAVAKGAFDVIRSPWHSTDVEMTLIRALREEDQQDTSHAVA
jgi:DNA-binding NtrC family response regulator